MSLQAYIGAKIVTAAKIVHVSKIDGENWLRHKNGSLHVEDAYMEKHKPEPGGYYVRYEDGYESFSPAEAFERAYRPLTEGEEKMITGTRPT